MLIYYKSYIFDNDEMLLFLISVVEFFWNEVFIFKFCK